MALPRLVRDGTARWRIDPDGGMRVPGVVFTSEDLLPLIEDDRSLAQVANVATLPGIVEASYAMPDMHRGYGFPIGGVAAADVAAGGVVSPGGVGFDISCGVRLHTAALHRDELDGALDDIMDRLDRTVPRGLGEGAVWDASERDVDAVLERGAVHAVSAGFGREEDLGRIEDGGALDDADAGAVSDRAIGRGADQLGSLGSGNHFLEVQAVAEVVDDDVAAAFGLEEGQVCVMIHTGSRGLGHQICQDYVARMEPVMREHDITVPDDQLACAPVDSEPGRSYLRAMAAGANFGRANRQALATAAREAFGAATGHGGLPLLYDVSHNLARLEDHGVDGRQRRLCVHRKGATLALPPGHPDLPGDLREAGQPVLTPGSMGTGSWVLTGVAGGRAFHSTCHGAGRTMSRNQARRRRSGERLRGELRDRGVRVRPGEVDDLPEEAPYAYKDVDEVVATGERADLARRVARLEPLGVVKG